MKFAEQFRTATPRCICTIQSVPMERGNTPSRKSQTLARPLYQHTQVGAAHCFCAQDSLFLRLCLWELNELRSNGVRREGDLDLFLFSFRICTTAISNTWCLLIRFFCCCVCLTRHQPASPLMTNSPATASRWRNGSVSYSRPHPEPRCRRFALGSYLFSIDIFNEVVSMNSWVRTVFVRVLLCLYILYFTTC